MSSETNWLTKIMAEVKADTEAVGGSWEPAKMISHAHKQKKEIERLTQELKEMSDDYDPEKGWYAQRFDMENGDIEYHAYGPYSSFVVFQGVRAKEDCKVFMRALGGICYG